MIHAFNFTCDRDTELSNLMVHTLWKHCDQLAELKVFNTDHNPLYKGYGNGAGWEASMMKLAALRNFSPADNDFILSVDSDVVFCNPEVFTMLDTNYGIIGRRHTKPFPTRLGLWGHMGGSLIFIRGDVARLITALPDEELNNIRYDHFKKYKLTENEDMVLSYLCAYVGAVHLALPNSITSGDFEPDIQQGKTMKSFYHLNYCPTSFLGEPVTGKWDIPRVLKAKGINP